MDNSNKLICSHLQQGSVYKNNSTLVCFDLHLIQCIILFRRLYYLSLLGLDDHNTVHLSILKRLLPVSSLLPGFSFELPTLNLNTLNISCEPNQLKIEETNTSVSTVAELEDSLNCSDYSLCGNQTIGDFISNWVNFGRSNVSLTFNFTSWEFTALCGDGANGELF